mgnify:CR=1 FL=1
MSKSAKNSNITITHLSNILSTIPETNHIKLHGSFNVLTPPKWKQEFQDNHDQHLLFVRSGEGRYCFHDEVIELKRGVIAFVSNNCIHKAEISIDNPLNILPMRFGFYCNKSGNQIKVDEPFYLSINTDINLINIYEEKFLDFYHKINYTEKNDLRSILAQTFISKILYTLLKQYQYPSNFKKTDKRVEQARNLIELNKNRNISIPEIANKVGLSERHLRTLFHQHYSISPKAYQLQTRLSYAHYLLSETKYSIKEITFMTGYSDPYIFSKQYKKYYGISPSKTIN